ncbi:MAG: DNA recombination protein RmuC [Flavobacteriales bacterium]|jgi:DNA recombination protein RmuC|nr:DNA recombination protein RmuC [Flavobacteriales bacterium]MBK6892613.1 DNA recombination protein RmuC [Flavobacteriales bacterium]MBK7286698.1 DNA recombination protein RmuC [Flavobacteriales bacterium]MBK9061007.1 DNA recombination protein RmuC [Flavobacteriales bacterium]MBK9598715.1 DNA recombination protein RmuC [Flavobacteriales bacterium]
MVWTSLLLGLLAGVILGAVAVVLWSRGKGAEAVKLVQDAREADRQDLGRQLAERDQRMQELQRELLAINGSFATERQRNEGLEEKLGTQKAELESLNERMTKEFKHIANTLMEEKGKQLTDRQEGTLKLLLDPFKERIKEFQEQVRTAYDKEGKERFLLKSEVAKLVEQNQRLSQDADNLTKALKGDHQSQGAWGEMILDKVLESSGLVKGQEYSMQESTTLPDGTRLRPDAVVMLPEEKHLIIDAKVSLLHYEQYCAATDDAQRAKFLKLHTESIRAHAKGLGEKNYTKIYDLSSVDFVLMFVPIEPAFLLALRERPEIFQEAYDRQVVMVTHGTLMATLRTIHGLWKNENVARHHMAIAERAGALYEKFVGFTEDIGRIGKHVNDAKDSYEKALGKLSEGNGNLIRQVEMLKELGAKTNKSIHTKLLERSVEEGRDA